MANKTLSTQQSGQVLDASHYLTLGSSPVNILAIEGEVNSTTGTAYYLQLLGTLTPATGVTVPLWSRLVVAAATGSGNNGFSFEYMRGGLDTATMNFPEAATVGGSNALPVVVAISSTDNVYTAVAANTQVAVTVEDAYLEIATQTVTGDLTTGVDSLAVYTDPNPTKRLVQFQAVNGTGAVGYVMLFAVANPANGDLPIQQWKVGIGVTLTERFGAGWPVQASDTAYALHTGCYLFGSSTTQVLTKTVATAWNLKAWNI
jgi:hypothetical protein